MEPDRETQELDAWFDEFEAAAKRPLRLRVRYAFVKTHRPVLDDEPFRAFDRMGGCPRRRPGRAVSPVLLKDRRRPESRVPILYAISVLMTSSFGSVISSIV